MDSEAIETISVKGNATFVLVHGAWGNRTVWERVELVLRRLGNRTYALNMPGHGGDPGNVAEHDGQSYAAALAEQIRRIPGKVILVGHSMGGSIITNIAERIPGKIEKLVYCAAFLLLPGQSGNGLDGNGIQPVNWLEYSTDGKTVLLSEYRRQNPAPNLAGKEENDVGELYDTDARESIASLQGKVCPTQENWGSLRRFYVYCSQDQAITPDLQRIMLKNLPCEAVYEIAADHGPQLSKPVELSAVLNEIARK